MSAATGTAGGAPAPRGLRFAGLGLAGDGDGGGYGPTTDPTGALATVSGDECVRQAIVMLLTTAPGERLLRPDYGTPLHRLAFAPNDGTTAGLAIHHVRGALARWEPRVEVLDLDAGADPDDPGQLVIALRYRVRATLTTDLLELSVSLTGAP